LPSVANLHHELQTYNDENLTDSVEIFLHCNGKIEKFPKVSNSETETSMLNIAKKYIDEISGEAYIKVEVHRTNGEEKGELHQNEKQIWNQPKNQEYYALAD
jgi:competence transcription factor ComK